MKRRYHFAELAIPWRKIELAIIVVTIAGEVILAAVLAILVAAGGAP